MRSTHSVDVFEKMNKKFLRPLSNLQLKKPQQSNPTVGAKTHNRNKDCGQKKLEDEITVLKESNQTLHLENHTLKNTVETMQQSIGSLKESIESLEESNGKLGQTNLAMSDIIEQMKATLSDLKAENEYLK